MGKKKKVKEPKHPMQPIVVDDNGVYRFKSNAIVRWLLDAGPFDMNILSVTPFSDNDRWQFAQLIGYSVSGIGDLGYHDRKELEIADETVERMLADGNSR